MIQKGETIITYPTRNPLDLVLYKKKTATLCEITDIATKNDTMTLSLKGMARVSLENIDKSQFARCSKIEMKLPSNQETTREELRKKAQELVFLINVEESDKLIGLINYVVDIEQMTDFISNYFILNFRQRYSLFCETDIAKRTAKLINLIDKVIATISKKRRNNAR